MNQLVRIVLFPLLVLLNVAALAESFPSPESNWKRQEAREAAASVDTGAELKRLLQLARQGQGRELEQALSDIEARTQWPMPAREQVLHAFAVNLADLDPGAVGPQVLRRLESRSPETWVPHEDHPGMAVPLFNIRAAVSGVRAEWERQDAAGGSAVLLAQGADRWIVAYARARPLQRQGLLDGLADADEASLRGLAEEALRGLPANAMLTEVATRSGLLLSDAALFGKALAAGSGPGLARALRSASERFSDDQNLAILAYSIEHALPTNAALALSQLAPPRLAEPEVADLVFETLENRDLGAAAALVLAASRDSGIQRRLQRRADQDHSLAARRAAMAMGVNRAQATGEER